jgi:YfiH family protein
MARKADGAALTPPRRELIVRLGLDAERLSVAGAAHGVDVARVEQPMGLVSGVDGLITDRPGLPLLATFADCRPLVLYDPFRRAVGLFHAGWRGSAAGMAKWAVAALSREYGCRPSDLVAGIGPGICGDCYEVGPEVAAHFDHACQRQEGSRRLLDVAAANRGQLITAGVRPLRIFLHPACTRETPALPSHRDSPDGTRFAGVVALR